MTRVRLRLAGESGPSTLPVVADEERIALPRPSVVIVAASPRADAVGMADAIASAAGASTRWRVQQREREGTERADTPSEKVLRASEAELAAGIATLVAEGADGLLVAVGAPLVSLARPDLAILVTGHAAPVQWEPALRAIRDRFELIVAEPRPALAVELAKRLRALA